VSIPYDVWEKLVKYYDEHQNDLVEKGIRSPSKLGSTWIEESLLRAEAIEKGYMKVAYKK
jgi:hypothetical protein